MEMELMENGLTQEEQAMQPDAVPELEPSGPDVPEPAENEVSEEPPKKKRTARKKTEKAADAPAPGDALEEDGEPPMPEDAPLEDGPLGEGLTKADLLDPEPNAAVDGIVVMGLAEQDVSDAPAEEPESVEAAVPPCPSQTRRSLSGRGPPHPGPGPRGRQTTTAGFCLWT